MKKSNKTAITRLMPCAAAILLLGLLAVPPAMAGIEPFNSEIRPASQNDMAQTLSSVDRLTMPAIDMVQVRMEDEIADQLNEAWRFAVGHDVLASTDDAGTWERLADGRMMWRLHVVSPGAKSLNLGFLRWVMPEGGQMFLYIPDYSYRFGPLTEEDNADHGEYWSPVLPGDELVVEILVPMDRMKDLEILLGSVNHGYRGFFADPPDTDAPSQSCNIDVVCPEGDAWRNEIRSVGVMQLGGVRLCTGAMVNNTANDFTPYFLTANHCGVTPGLEGGLRVYWNYENTWCREPWSSESGGQGDGDLTQSQRGATERADGNGSDFCLVELDDAPDPDWNVHWAGWDNSGTQATSAVAIHHPNTQEKRISFENDPTTSASGGSHVRVNDYDAGSTEGGSSGCPLFNQDHRIIGQLEGGTAACGNNGYDVFGAVSWSWNGATAADRLKDWLDPLNTGQETINGIGGGSSAGIGTIVTGPGPVQSNPALTRVWDLQNVSSPSAEWTAYGPDSYGVNVACGDLNGSGRDWVITGAGPGAVYGPHVRGFTPEGAAISSISFLAYGTNKWGVNVACGDVDNDGRDEIITGPGPGAVFGPHIRGWNHDGGSSVSPIGGISFFAYGTLKFGANVTVGDIDGDSYDEIVTGAGPGAVFGPHVRGWNVDGGVAASIPGVSFLAYGTNQYGVNVVCGDIDADGIDEIVTGAGPGQIFSAHVRAWNYDGGTLAAMPGVSFFAYEGTKKGVRVGVGDVDDDGVVEILTMPGPYSTIGAQVRAFDVNGGTATQITGIDFDAYDSSVTHGGNVAGGILD